MPTIRFLLLALIFVACTPAASSGGPSLAPAAPVAPAAPAAPMGPSLPATVVDKDGRTVTIPAIDRIVSLNGDLTEVVFALGLGDRLVGIDTSATYPPAQVASIPKIGYQRTLNTEGILALAPTVIIGSSIAGPPAVIEQLRAAGVPVAIGEFGETLEAPARKIRFVAAALGVRERGEQLVAELNRDLAAVEQAIKSVSTQPKPKVLFLYLRGAAVQSVAGSGTTGDTVIRAAGGINAAAELGIEGTRPLSQEILVAAQPEVLLFLDAGLASVGGIEGLLAANPALAETPAGRNRRFVSLEDQYLLGLGPRAGKAIGDLARAFYPSLR
ncbi:MAG: hemin ABC transporter substrate-binding protein [Dehalococcoidia bacterium]|nr:MAG: hemin ABC transporter substrate-binding protein [Dehalococcoidia bacterium]